jgi:hypothetical protein
MTVTWQQLNSAQGILNCELTMVGIPDLMDEDEASETYFPTEDDTETIKALLIAVAGATLDCYSHCTAYTIVWDSDEEDDPLLNHQPKDSFRIPVGGSRLAAFRRLLERTACVHRFENDGKIHIFMPTTSGSSYDYEYSLATGEHAFFSKAYRKSLVIPNKVVVQSESDDDPQYSGNATHAASYALLPKIHYVTGTLASNDEAEDIAQAIINRYALNAEMGAAEVPMNVGAELYDYVKVTDAREGDYRIGNIGGITRTYKPGKYQMEFHFGDPPSEAYLKDLYQSIKGTASSSMGDNADFNTLRVKRLYVDEFISLDDIQEGTTYKRVLSTQITAGKILLSDACEYNAGYDPSGKRRTFTATPTTPYDVGDLWLDASTVKRCTTARATGAYNAADWTATTLDAIADGSSYQRVQTAALSAAGLVLLDQVVIGDTYGLVNKTDISAGHILLSSTVASGEWYDESGVAISASTGINIYGTANALTTRATKTGTIQCYVGSDGKLYAGAGAIELSSSGLKIVGQSLTHYYGDTLTGWLYGGTYGLALTAASGKSLSLGIGATYTGDGIGFVNAPRVNMSYCEYLDMPQRSSHPTGVNGRKYHNTTDHKNYAYYQSAWDQDT